MDHAFRDERREEAGAGQTEADLDDPREYHREQKDRGSFRINNCAATMAMRPAAGPLTLVSDPLRIATTIPPTTPAINPANGSAFDASATPKHSGSATRKTISPALASANTEPTDIFSAVECDLGSNLGN